MSWSAPTNPMWGCGLWKSGVSCCTAWNVQILWELWEVPGPLEALLHGAPHPGQQGGPGWDLAVPLPG